LILDWVRQWILAFACLPWSRLCEAGVGKRMPEHPSLPRRLICALRGFKIFDWRLNRSGAYPLKPHCWSVMISFACGHCNKQFRVKDELAGKKGKCPACGQPIAVPALATAASSREEAEWLWLVRYARKCVGVERGNADDRHDRSPRTSPSRRRLAQRRKILRREPPGPEWSGHPRPRLRPPRGPNCGSEAPVNPSHLVPSTIDEKEAKKQQEDWATKPKMPPETANKINTAAIHIPADRPLRAIAAVPRPWVLVSSPDSRPAQA